MFWTKITNYSVEMHLNKSVLLSLKLSYTSVHTGMQNILRCPMPCYVNFNVYIRIINLIIDNCHFN